MKSLSFNTDTKEVTIQGVDTFGAVRTATWEISDYIKKARQYVKYKERIDKIRAKHDLENYEYEELHEIISKTSQMIKGKYVRVGLENRIKTVKDKLYGKNKGSELTKIKEAVINLDKLRKDKYESFSDPDQLMLKSGMTKEDINYYKKENGQFRSKKKEKEYIREFNKIAKDTDFSWSEFFNDMYENYSEDIANYERTTNGKSYGQLWDWYMDKEAEERREIMADYLADEVEEDEEEMQSIRKGIGKRK